MSDDNLKCMRQNENYYIPGGDLHLLADGQLFRVHRYFFERESAKLKEKLALPASPGKSRQGTTDSTAILLDVSATDLEKFLWVFYNPTYTLYDATFEDWSAILRLAHRWGFPQVKSLCLRQLEALKVPIVDRIVLYQAYQVEDEILIPRYCQLCARDELLSVEEGERLGMTTALMICSVREQVRSTAVDGLKSPLPPNTKSKDVFAAVKAVLSGNPVATGCETKPSDPLIILKDPKLKNQTNKGKDGNGVNTTTTSEKRMK